MERVNKKYRITLTDAQLDVYRDALEFYSRFLAGQMDYLPQAFEAIFCKEKGHTVEEMHAFREQMNSLKSIAFPELPYNGCHGVGDHTIPERDIAYTMYREVLVYKTRKAMENGRDVSHSVYNGPTLNYTKEPLPVVEEVNEIDELYKIVSERHRASLDKLAKN